MRRVLGSAIIGQSQQPFYGSEGRAKGQAQTQRRCKHSWAWDIWSLWKCLKHSFKIRVRRKFRLKKMFCLTILICSSLYLYTFYTIIKYNFYYFSWRRTHKRKSAPKVILAPNLSHLLKPVRVFVVIEYHEINNFSFIKRMCGGAHVLQCDCSFLISFVTSQPFLISSTRSQPLLG